MEPHPLTPFGDLVLLRHATAARIVRGIIMPDKSKLSATLAQVIAVGDGDKVKNIEIGSWVLLMRNNVTEIPIPWKDAEGKDTLLHVHAWNALLTRHPAPPGDEDVFGDNKAAIFVENAVNFSKKN